ncbi:sulfatase-like hydrolase/transferase [Limibacter armeniacum]|uniref:sulfatase-like hydrolase/transferase n=1 Tax=Limibacter armeniacum TaxID=466084 RepID=UPI002FE61747
MKYYFLLLCLLGLFRFEAGAQEKKHPNIIILYVDDLGYGDVGCYGAKGVKTPNIDKMADNGLMMTDAHCAAAMCTPSRFSLLTGKYAFRNKAEILPGDAPLLIRPETPTLPSMLKKAGYRTGVVGKWHLGLGNGTVDWNEDITPGPLEIGFDYSFLIPATGDRVPTVFVENHRVVGLDPNDPITVSYKKKVGDDPTGIENPEMLRVKADPQHSNTIVNGVSRIGYMAGGKQARWVDEEFPDKLTEKAIAFMDTDKEKPFFLYYSFHDIHVPRLPHARFTGASKMGPRGDAIAQVDWVVGEIVKALEVRGIAEETMIIFSSDNGPVLDDGYEDQAEELIGKHKPGGPFKGGKYSIYEAGTRVPTIVYWPSTIKSGKSNALFTQTDLYASLAELTGQTVEDGEAPDSENHLQVLLGVSEEGRTELIEEAFVLALRQGDWKYIAPVENDTPDWLKNKKVAHGIGNEPQLYNLRKDPKEQKNLAEGYPEKVAEMQQRLAELVKQQQSN